MHQQALRLFDAMLTKMTPNNVTFLAAFTSCAKLADANTAVRLYDEFRKRGIALNTSLCCALISMHAKCCNISSAEKVSFIATSGAHHKRYAL